jgi:nicotinamide-nucleotide amidase
VASALGLPLEEAPDVLASIRQRFTRRGLEMPEINRRQAQVPRGATMLPNPKGTAPGLWIDVDGRVVVLLPGPPRELEPMWDAEVHPRLAARTGARRVRRRVIKITGRAESQVEEVAQPVYGPMAFWPIPVQTTILAAPGQIELHVSTRSDDPEGSGRALDDAVRALVDALGDVVFAIDGRTLPEVVGDLLRERSRRLAVAESCTGGMVLGRLTDVPGSSAWVVGGVIAYANDVKIEQLGVPAELLAAHGAVSEPVAVAMAEGACERLHADIAASVTGIAGPTGGTEAKPVGTVAIAVVTRPVSGAAEGRATAVRTFRFVGDRPMIRQQAAQAALDLVRRALLQA